MHRTAGMTAVDAAVDVTAAAATVPVGATTRAVVAASVDVGTADEVDAVA